MASGPSLVPQIQNPKWQNGRFDFGLWILEVGIWDRLVFVLFAATPNGAVWILEFGFWRFDFWFFDLDYLVT